MIGLYRLLVVGIVGFTSLSI